MPKLPRLSISLLIAGALVAVALAGTALASTHARSAGAAAASYPPCTKAALKAGLRRGPVADRHGRFIKPFGCARNWAYSAVLVGRGQDEFEGTALYHAVNGRWQTSERGGPCRTHAVPKKIYQPACETN
jgi:hypothetical protein